MWARLQAFLSLLAVCLLAAMPLRAQAQDNGAPAPGQEGQAQDNEGPAPPGRSGEARLALIVGNDGYEAQVPTAANDAGLIADTLRSAEFDVSGARNLDRETLRGAIREFVDKAAKANSNVVTFVYFAGYAVQFNGENFLVPVNARIERAEDIPEQAIPLSEITAPLAELPGRARIVVLDAAHQSPYPRDGQQVAGGLALVEPQDRGLIAINAAPGTVAPIEEGSYGSYASALAEMIRTGGLPLEAVFDRVRLKVSDATKGAVVPWHASKLREPFSFFELAPDAPRREAMAPVDQTRPIGSFPEREAYSAALTRDTLPAYQDYLRAYPQAASAARVRVILAARREALTWQRAVAIGSPQAYWTYLRRYPDGAHSWDARRRLALLSAPAEPPGTFGGVDFAGVPPPPGPEFSYIRGRRFVAFGDYDLPPPPPPPVIFLPPPPPWWVPPPPPPPAFAPFFLPVPRPFIAPRFVTVPRGVRRPPPPVLFVQEGEGDRRGRRFAEAVAAGTVAGAAAAVLFRLPGIVQRRVEKRDRIIAVPLPRRDVRGPGRAGEGRPQATPGRLLPGQALPGARPIAVGIQAPQVGLGAIPRVGARPAGSPGERGRIPSGPGAEPERRGGPRVGAPLPSGRDLPRPTGPGSREPVAPPLRERVGPGVREPGVLPERRGPEGPAGGPRPQMLPNGRPGDQQSNGPQERRLPGAERPRQPGVGPAQAGPRPTRPDAGLPAREPPPRSEMPPRVQPPGPAQIEPRREAVPPRREVPVGPPPRHEAPPLRQQEPRREAPSPRRETPVGPPPRREMPPPRQQEPRREAPPPRRETPVGPPPRREMPPPRQQEPRREAPPPRREAPVGPPPRREIPPPRQQEPRREAPPPRREAPAGPPPRREAPPPRQEPHREAPPQRREAPPRTEPRRDGPHREGPHREGPRQEGPRGGGGGHEKRAPGDH